MGSSESSTVNASKHNIPPKLSLPPPVIKYNNYPTGYGPDPYGQIFYPPPYPLASYGVYPPDQFYPPPPYMEQPLKGQRSPRHHHHNDHTSRCYSHHHHHDHHRSHSPAEPKPSNRPLREEFATASYPVPPPPPPAPTKPPVSSVVTFKVPSPDVKKQSVQRSASLAVKNPPPTNNVTVTTPRRQSPPRAIVNNPGPSLTIKPNDFQKAPRVATNHLSKPDDTISVHKFGPDLLTVVPGNTFSAPRSGNRWYDHDYDKRVRPLTIDHL